MQSTGDIQSAIISGIRSDLQGISAESNLSFRYTFPGDKVYFSVRGRGKNRYPKIDRVEPGSERKVIPECKYFSKCGGCSGQHIEYSSQIRFKTEEVLTLFQENFSLQLDVVPSEKTYQYRNRMDFAVFPGKTGLRQAENFRNIIDIDKCLLQSHWANKELSVLRQLIEKNQNLVLDRKTESGFLKYVTLRTNSGSSDTISIFTFSDDFKDSELESSFAQEVLKVSTAKNIVFCYNRKKSEVSAEGSYKTIKGNHTIIENFLDRTFIIPFNSFFQPNPEGFKPIIRFTDRILKKISAGTLLDLFCGTGFFSILFGHHFKSIYGYDWTESSIQTALSNLKRIYPDTNICFEKKDLLQIEGILQSGSFDTDTVLIMDPPRNGIGKKVIDSVIKSNIPYLIYISCNPYSQLNDLKELKDHYIIKEGLITDPFPQTPHLESAVFMQRKEI